MNSFLETICILDSIPRNVSWHQQRIDNTFLYCMPHADPFQLETKLTLFDLPREGKIKCSIQYFTEITDVTFSIYAPKPVTSLKLIEVPRGFEYCFKLTDRHSIDTLFSKKGNADDILMTRNGWILDTSIANIAFRKKDLWYTPANPLLAGTTWKRLMEEGILIPRPIHQSDIPGFDAFKVFNAMNDWREAEEGPIDGIS